MCHAEMFDNAPMSSCNKAITHEALSTNANWYYSGWSSFVCEPPPPAPPSAPPPSVPPPFAPPPSAPPPSIPGPVGQITGDPHITGAHGDSADFKGADGAIYCLLSTQRLSMNARFEHARFKSPYSKLIVYGSWIRNAYWIIRTNRNRQVNIRLDARLPSFNGSTASSTAMIDDVKVSFSAPKGAMRGAISVRTPQWFTSAEVTKGRPHFGQVRITIKIQPLYNMSKSRVAPQ